MRVRFTPEALEAARAKRAWWEVASRSKWHRIEALLRNRAFIEDYIRARDAWREGNLVAFPPGTYWLRRVRERGRRRDVTWVELDADDGA